MKAVEALTDAVLYCLDVVEGYDIRSFEVGISAFMYWNKATAIDEGYMRFASWAHLFVRRWLSHG